MKTAVLDIGSNSVRLMWGTEGALNRKIIRTTQLAEGLDSSGRLAENAMERTLVTMAELVRIALDGGAKSVAAFATEAVRRAENGSVFCRLVKERVGLDVDVIDGKTEAACGFFGAKEGFSGVAGILDIGGASVELSVGNTRVEYARSLPIGIVRLKERYGGGYERFTDDLEELVAPFREAPSFDTLIGIGGTPTSLVAIADRATEYDPTAVHGRRVGIDEALRVAQETSAMTADQFTVAFPTIERRRAEVLPYGMWVLYGVLRAFGLDALLVSEKDNLEGYARIRGLD